MKIRNYLGVRLVGNASSNSDHMKNALPTKCILDLICRRKSIRFKAKSQTCMMRGLCLYTTRPAKTNLKTSARQPEPNGLQSPNGMAGAHQSGFLLERLSYDFVAFLSCCKKESLEISCSYWWGVTLRVIGSFASMSLSGADVQRQVNTKCHLYLSTKCVKMIIFN